MGHPHIIMPPQQHYVQSPPLLLISHTVPHPPQAAGTPPPSVTSAPPSIILPPGHILAYMPPSMNHPPPGPPPTPQHSGPHVTSPSPHHYNPNSLPQFTEDQRTLSYPFTEPRGMSPGTARTKRATTSSTNAGSAFSNPSLPGPHQSDQRRYRPCYP